MTNTLATPTHQPAAKGPRTIGIILVLAVLSIVLAIVLLVLASRRRSAGAAGARG